MLQGIGVRALPLVEQDGLIWVFPGELSLATGEFARPPAMAQPPAGFQVHAELVMDVPVEHGLLLENLLDLAHAPFTHTSTFAKGWPIPGGWSGPARLGGKSGGAWGGGVPCDGTHVFAAAQSLVAGEGSKEAGVQLLAVFIVLL